MGISIIRVGYDYDSFDTVLAIHHHLETHSEYIKTYLKGKKYQRYVESLLMYLAKNHAERQRFMEHGGHISTVIDDMGNVQKLVDG